VYTGFKQVLQLWLCHAMKISRPIEG
jgi:hypothetical protein